VKWRSALNAGWDVEIDCTQIIADYLQSIPKPCVAGQQFRVPDDSVKTCCESEKRKIRDLIEHDVEERIVTTQHAFDVSAGVHFEREGLLHV
jgi:hypothetical protein